MNKHRLLTLVLPVLLGACGSLTAATPGTQQTEVSEGVVAATGISAVGRSGLESTYAFIDGTSDCAELANFRAQLDRDLKAWESEGNETSAGFFRDYVAAADARLVELACVWFGTCADAPGPIRNGEPGYRAELDRDGDGVACDS